MSRRPMGSHIFHLNEDVTAHFYMDPVRSQNRKRTEVGSFGFYHCREIRFRETAATVANPGSQERDVGVAEI